MNELRTIRKTLFDMTQQELGDVIGVDQSTIARWENGTRPFPKYGRALYEGLARGKGVSLPWTEMEAA